MQWKMTAAVLGRSFALASVAATAAQAQVAPNPTLPGAGVRELSFSGQLASRPTDSYDIQVRYGPFQDSRLQVGGELGLGKVPGVRTTALGVFANYHFPRAAAQLPFMGLYLGTINHKGDGSSSSTVWGFQSGIKYFLNSAVAVTPQLVYRKPGKSHLAETLALQASISLFLR